jgi:hypothetical protein
LQRPGTGDEITWDRSTQKSKASTSLQDKNPKKYIRSCVLEIYIKFIFINEQETHITVVPITFKHFLCGCGLFHRSLPTPGFLVEEKHINHHPTRQDPHFSAQ